MPWPACHNLIVTKPWPWVWIYLSQNKYFSGCIVFLLNQEWVFFLPLPMFLSISFVLESPSFINLWHLFHNVDLSNDQKVLSVHVAHILVLAESSHPVKTAEFIYCHGVPSLWSYFFQELLHAFTSCTSSCRGAHITHMVWQGSGERGMILSWDFVHLNCLLGENILLFLSTQL